MKRILFCLMATLFSMVLLGTSIGHSSDEASARFYDGMNTDWFFVFRPNGNNGNKFIRMANKKGDKEILLTLDQAESMSWYLVKLWRAFKDSDAGFEKEMDLGDGVEIRCDSFGRSASIFVSNKKEKLSFSPSEIDGVLGGCLQATKKLNAWALESSILKETSSLSRKEIKVRPAPEGYMASEYLAEYFENDMASAIGKITNTSFYLYGEVYEVGNTQDDNTPYIVLNSDASPMHIFCVLGRTDRIASVSKGKYVSLHGQSYGKFTKNTIFMSNCVIDGVFDIDVLEAQ